MAATSSGPSWGSPPSRFGCERSVYVYYKSLRGPRLPDRRLLCRVCVLYIAVKYRSQYHIKRQHTPRGARQHVR